jgi:hypothetical protein
VLELRRMVRVVHRVAGARAQRDSWSLHVDGMAVCRIVAAVAVDNHWPLHGKSSNQVRKARVCMGYPLAPTPLVGLTDKRPSYPSAVCSGRVLAVVV